MRQSAHCLRTRGHDVIVLTNRFPRDLPAFELLEGIPVHRLRFVGGGSAEGGLDGLKTRLQFALIKPRTELKVAEIIEAHGSEILHVHCVSNNAFYALQERDRASKPLIVTAHGERTMDANGIYERSQWLNATLRRALQKADFITACSQHTLSDLKNYSSDRFEGRSQVVHSGMRLADFNGITPYSHPRPYILGIGRLVAQKGFDNLIRAFERANLGEVDLILAGDGPEKEPLERLVEEITLASRVHFVGQASRAQAAALFLGCLFFVLPSRMEPQGIVNLEAMAAGKAVAASRVGGVPEIVMEGETGLLFDPENEAEIAATLQKLAQDAELRDQLGAAGRARAEKFDWEEITDQYEEIYRRLRA